MLVLRQQAHQVYWKDLGYSGSTGADIDIALFESEEDANAIRHELNTINQEAKSGKMAEVRQIDIDVVIFENVDEYRKEQETDLVRGAIAKLSNEELNALREHMRKQ